MHNKVHDKLSVNLIVSIRQANNMSRPPRLLGIPQDTGMQEGAHKAMTGESTWCDVRLRPHESSYQAGSGLAKQAGEVFNFAPFKASEGEVSAKS